MDKMRSWFIMCKAQFSLHICHLLLDLCVVVEAPQMISDLGLWDDEEKQVKWERRQCLVCVSGNSSALGCWLLSIGDEKTARLIQELFRGWGNVSVHPSLSSIYCVYVERTRWRRKEGEKKLEKNSLLFFSSPEQQLGFLGGMETRARGSKKRRKTAVEKDKIYFVVQGWKKNHPMIRSTARLCLEFVCLQLIFFFVVFYVALVSFFLSTFSPNFPTHFSLHHHLRHRHNTLAGSSAFLLFFRTTKMSETHNHTHNLCNEKEATVWREAHDGMWKIALESVKIDDKCEAPAAE